MAAEAVKVIVRCRPMNDREKNLDCHCVIEMDNGRAQCNIHHLSDEKTPPKSFSFDGTYFTDSNTETIYNEIGYPLVEGVTEGYNGTIFAYGQTGCGKSFTMQGITDPPNQRGIIPRAFDHIFETISVVAGTKFLVHAAYLEIYNEEIRDLLGKDTKAKLDLKEHPEKGVYVQNLSMHAVHNVSECERVMVRGWSNRATGATLMNADSSRSHSIFTIFLEMISPDDNGDEHIRAGKLNLVDLAGSERQSKTGSTGDRLKEATKINLSLSALGNVISALVDGKSKHIPYRDSKLTRLLQDSLGGNTKTLMVACISPADNNYDESLSTLRYANRAKNIKNKPKINEDPKDALLREYQEEIMRLKAMLMGQLPVTQSTIDTSAPKEVVKTVTHGDSTGSAADVSREDLEREKFRLKQEYDNQLHAIQAMYEEEKFGKVRLQDDISRLREFYDQRLSTVDGQIAHLPPTAAVLGEIEWHSEQWQRDGASANETIRQASILSNGPAVSDKLRVSSVASEDITDELHKFDDVTLMAQQRALQMSMSHSVESMFNGEQSLISIQPEMLNVQQMEMLNSYSSANGVDPKKLLAEMQKEVMSRLQSLQQQMVGGENADNTEIKERRQCRKKFAEQRKEKLADAVSNMDDDGIMLDIYDDIHGELKMRSALLDMAKDKTTVLETEIKDIQAEFEIDRIDYLETIRKQGRKMLLMQAMIDRMQPLIRKDCNYSNLDRIFSDCHWDDDLSVWVLPKITLEKSYSIPGLQSAALTDGLLGTGSGPFKQPSPDGGGSEMHTAPHTDNQYSSDRLIKKLQRNDGIAGSYFQPKRAPKILSQSDQVNAFKLGKQKVVHVNGIHGTGQIPPIMNGHHHDENMTGELHTVQHHRQMNPSDEIIPRRPLRLEALPTQTTKKTKKKKNQLEQL